MTEPSTDLGLWGLPIAVLGGALRVGTPYLFVSLGECLTEKSGRVNLGLEGTLCLGAMSGYALSYHTGSPWAGVAAAALAGGLLGVMHASICSLRRVNSVAVGIAMMSFGIGLANYLGKPYIQPTAPQLPAVDFGWWSSIEQLRAALRVNVLFIFGALLAPLLAWGLKNTRWGLMLRVAGESEEAAAAMGYSTNRIRVIATALGGVLAGIGGSYLSLYYPGSWSEQISSGQGLMAIALVIFAKWDPIRCLGAALLFGGVGSLGLALQSQGLASASQAYLWNAAPYVLTVGIMIATSSRVRAMAGAPAELGRVR
ncbi:ABC transporter permease [Planctomycetaceae bacterium SCGC AG-212-D15]|nr:ABC transporter permease [Planctomycetaceae bacterium SCGC AG-212-D15]